MIFNKFTNKQKKINKNKRKKNIILTKNKEKLYFITEIGASMQSDVSKKIKHQNHTEYFSVDQVV